MSFCFHTIEIKSCKKIYTSRPTDSPPSPVLDRHDANPPRVLFTVFCFSFFLKRENMPSQVESSPFTSSHLKIVILRRLKKGEGVAFDKKEKTLKWTFPPPLFSWRQLYKYSALNIQQVCEKEFTSGTNTQVHTLPSLLGDRQDGVKNRRWLSCTFSGVFQ